MTLTSSYRCQTITYQIKTHQGSHKTRRQTHMEHTFLISLWTINSPFSTEEPLAIWQVTLRAYRNKAVAWSITFNFAILQALNNDVNYMKVLDLTPFSDHKPLSMELHCKHIKIECMLPLEQQYEPAPTRFIFNEGNRDAFIQGLGTESSQQTLKDLQDTIDRLRDSTTDNNSLTTTTINATNCFRQSKHMNTNKQNKPWFNWQTRTGKQELRKVRLPWQ